MFERGEIILLMLDGCHTLEEIGSNLAISRERLQELVHRIVKELREEAMKGLPLTYTPGPTEVFLRELAIRGASTKELEEILEKASKGIETRLNK